MNAPIVNFTRWILLRTYEYAECWRDWRNGDKDKVRALLDRGADRLGNISEKPSSSCRSHALTNKVFMHDGWCLTGNRTDFSPRKFELLGIKELDKFKLLHVWPDRYSMLGRGTHRVYSSSLSTKETWYLSKTYFITWNHRKQIYIIF